MNAEVPENGNGSSPKTSHGGRENAAIVQGFSDVTIDEMIGMHLIDCDQCRKASLAKPVAIGQKSGHCDTYWQLQLMRAKREGSANNIVAYTEFGDEAQKGRPLE